MTRVSVCLRPASRSGARHISTCVALLVLVCLAACTSLPSLQGRSETFAIADTGNTRLGRAVTPLTSAHPDKTGIHALQLGSDGFAARAVLARAAERTLDLQYYLWQGDQTGYLLMEQVWDAAQRGVRVRMLIDDTNTAGLDETIAALDALPNIEVRLYNPFVYRSHRGLNFVTDFTRVNHRMHNKSFTVDNQVAIVGGRNVGNEYFEAGQVVFRDLDAIVVGAAVQEVSKEFDLYWNSASAYPAGMFVGNASADSARWLEAKFEATRADPVSLDYLQVVRDTPLLEQFLGGKLPLEWTHAQLVRDDPAKTLDTTDRTDILLISDVLQIMGRPQTSIDLISPYFVPGERGTAVLASLARDGVKIRVLTNSLASTDVASVHAGYMKHRCDLLRGGVQLYELKPSAVRPGKRPAGASASTGLHAKTFATDRNRIFIGSFNFDPRSAHLNTEMGLVIDSPDLAQKLSHAFDVDIPNLAYEPRLLSPADCSLEWIEQTSTGQLRYTSEPGTSAARRALVDVLSVLPIEWLL